MKIEELYRVECICNQCNQFLMGTNVNPHFTKEELEKSWSGIVTSAPLNAPKCPNCNYSTDRDYNAGIDFLVDNGTSKVSSDIFFIK